MSLATPDVRGAHLRELAGRLQELEAVTNETNRELKAAGLATAEGRESAEHLLNRALALMDHLSEVAEDMTRRLDELAERLVAGVDRATNRPRRPCSWHPLRAVAE
jgi:hypothetical protein